MLRFSQVIRRAGAAAGADAKPKSFVTHKLGSGEKNQFTVHVTDKIELSANQVANVSMAQLDGAWAKFARHGRWSTQTPPVNYRPSSTIDVRAHFEPWSIAATKWLGVKDNDLALTMMSSMSLIRVIEIKVTDTSTNPSTTWNQRVTVLDPPSVVNLKLMLGFILGLSLGYTLLITNDKKENDRPDLPSDYEPDEAQVAKMEAILAKCRRLTLSLLTGQRGQGKTSTAVYVANQTHSSYIVFYILAKELQNSEELDQRLKDYEERIERVEKELGETMRNVKLLFGTSSAATVLAAVSQLPLVIGATAGAGVYCLAFWALRPPPKPHVVIIDDFTAKDKKNADLSAAEVSSRLGLITSFSNRHRTLLLSSNEGINACFTDIAPAVRNLRSLPDPSPATLEKYLVSRFDISKEDANKIVNYADKHLPQHWSRSFRFYAKFGDIGKLSEYLLPKEEAPDDDPLMKVPLETWAMLALSLDLATAPTTRPMALACSPAIEPEKRKKLVKLLGVPDDAIPENCPRRLALAHGLAERKEELKDSKMIAQFLACDMDRANLTQAKTLIQRGWIRNTFFNDLAPILKKYDKGFHDDLLARLDKTQNPSKKETESEKEKEVESPNET